MTGLAQEQVTDLVTAVAARVGVWQRPVGRPRVMGLYRAVVLTLFLLRHNNSQDVAGDPFPGARHDAYAFDASGIAQRWAGHMTTHGPGLLGDKGYQGTGAHSPYKKPPGGQLTAVQKQCNRAHSSVRSAVERAIAHLTRWRILDTGWRGRLSEFPDLLRTVTALEIYRARE